MKSKVLLSVIRFVPLLFAPLYAFTQDVMKDSAELVKIEQQLMNDIGPGVKTNWEKYLLPDCIIVTEDGSRLDTKSFLGQVQPMAKSNTGHINVTDPRVVIKGSNAVISYVADEYETVYDNKLHTTYGVMDTYVKSSGDWQMISMQVFEIPQLPSAIHVQTTILQKYVGTYIMGDTNFCKVFVRSDSLFYQNKGRAEVALYPETENVFFRDGDTRGRKIFTPDDKGTMLMRARRNGEDVVWRRVRSALESNNP